MEAVNAFNMELFSMIDMKPPISRAKMMSITKAAVKAIKLYKHVVQIVEKFIKRCKPELKVPGLYVVDSIVRQSRHQFGVDKDVFGPRFLKNFTDTFQNLYNCPEDDKSKIVRVLNLWQKNGVFDMDIIQPLMDMANSVPSPAPSIEELQPPPAAAAPVAPPSQMPTSDALAAVAQLFQSPHGQELQRMLHSLQQAERIHAASGANGPNAHQLNAARPEMLNAHSGERGTLAEKLLNRFEYDDEPEDVAPNDPADSLNVSGQLHDTEMVHPHPLGQNAGSLEHGGVPSDAERHMLSDGFYSRSEPQNSKSQADSREDPSTQRDGRHRASGRRTRSGSISPRRRRSRSSSRSRRPRYRRSRSRSREGRWRRSRSQDRNERERDRARRQKGLPSMKSQTLSVCSTTLWVGQLDKKTQQSDVISLLEEFGQIESVNMIPPRGCAYIVMVHRLDAYTALNKLSRGSYKVNQKPVKIAWALNKGIKVAHKKFWDVERGVTYIPWTKVKAEELDSYRAGGMLDPDTLSEEWKSVLDLNKHPMAGVNGALESAPADGSVEAQIQVPGFQQVGPMGSPPQFLPPGMLSPSGGLMLIPPELKPDATAAAVKSPTELTPTLEGDKPSPVGPVINLQAPPPGLPPMHHSHPPHLQPFHSPPTMMPAGPAFPPERFRMALPFPPRGPMLHPRPPFMRPEGMMVGHAGPPFRGRSSFGGPAPRHPRGGW
ncbi:SR-related and CTD-associated factor 4b [Hippocampus zosterae]|uniref:SR-related and CTD-associated factor 4b n=1 Tax=Hippocampus zosterae TaxID=109293 RepID=UPI00223DE850|nr:SR-related and CTD-associated factor 4b [Hippocampus zosterae]